MIESRSSTAQKNRSPCAFPIQSANSNPRICGFYSHLLFVQTQNGPIRLFGQAMQSEMAAPVRYGGNSHCLKTLLPSVAHSSHRSLTGRNRSARLKRRRPGWDGLGGYSNGNISTARPWRLGPAHR
jgi:hypothetical protein